MLLLCTRLEKRCNVIDVIPKRVGTCLHVCYKVTVQCSDVPSVSVGCAGGGSIGKMLVLEWYR